MLSHSGDWFLRAGAAVGADSAEVIELRNTSRPLARGHGDREPSESDGHLVRVRDPCEEDPLNGDCELTGYPARALDVATVALCDTSRNANLRHGSKEMFCAEDRTCVACRPRYEHNKKRIAAFREGSLQAARAKVFAERFGPPGNRSVVVVGVNYGQVFLFANWACSVHDIGLDPLAFTYVVATDVAAHEAVGKMGFVVEPLTWLAKAGEGEISERYRGHANVGPHSEINTMTLAGVEAALLLGYPALLMDVDIVWKRDVLAYLRSVSVSGRDVIGSYSPRDDAYGFVNGGAVYFRPSRKARIFVQTLVNMCTIKQLSDQILLNAMLRNYRFRQLGLAIVPMHVFNTDWGKRARSYAKSYLVHTVGEDKADRLMAADLWFLSQQCPLYDESYMEQPISRGVVNETLHKEAGAKAAKMIPQNDL